MRIYAREEKKLLYVLIPKAGCTTIIYELFYKPRYGNVLNLSEIHKKLPPQTGP
jgi:hypothetical protein